MKKRRIIKIINIFLTVVFVFAAFNIGKIYYDYNKADTAYKDLQSSYVTINKDFSVSTKPENDTPEDTDAEHVQESAPKLEEPTNAPLTVDFNALLNRNKDIIGWLYCPDTIINYPVVQGKSNDQYLRRDLDGKYLVSGTVFADYRNGTLTSDPNYIIYGHNMKNGSMFNILAKYKQQEFYDKHPIIYYLTPDATYRLELFAGLVIKRNDKIYTLNQNKEEFLSLAEEYRAKSTFKSNTVITPEDTVVTLSTCSYEFDNARYIVMCKLVEI